jgi:hypothetical protein
MEKSSSAKEKRRTKMKTVEPMEFKTLRHKKFHDIFGVFYDNEICHSGTPNLQPMTATMEGMKKYFADQPIVFEQLEDYELVELQVGSAICHPIQCRHHAAGRCAHCHQLG